MIKSALIIIIELASGFFTNSGMLGGFKNVYRIFFEDGSWSQLSTLSVESNQISDEWVAAVDTQGIILHALGSYERPNTLEAARQSFLTGIKLLEVDIFKDEDNRLRCHHGPELPPMMSPSSCTLERLLKILPSDHYLVLDIKTDFAGTADSVVGLLRAGISENFKSKQIIFQLYKPSDVRWFHSTVLANKKLIFSQPIITSYKTHADVAFLSQIKPRFVGAIAFPKFRDSILLSAFKTVPFLTSLPTLFVHPVSSCEEFSQSLRNGISAVYGPRSLSKCDRYKF